MVRSLLRLSCFTLALFCCLVFQAAQRPYVLLFGSADCDQCTEIRRSWGTLGDKRPEECVLVYISIDDNRNYLFLKALERALKIEQPGTSFPMVLAGRRMVSGRDGFWRLVPELKTLLAEEPPKLKLLASLHEAVAQADEPVISWSYPRKAAQKSPETATPDVAEETSPRIFPGRLLYLSTPGCQKCARQEAELRLLKEMLPSLEVSRYEITAEEGQVMAARVRLHFGMKDDGTSLAPLVAWQDGYVTGELATAERLAEELSALEKRLRSAEAGAAGGVIHGPIDEPFWTVPITQAEREANRNANRGFLEHMTITATLLAGLIDGINPCAFATVIFLVSYLLYLKRGRRFVLLAGGLFCLGVFGSYLLFGVGISYIVDYLNRFALFKRIFYWSFSAVGLVLAALHLRDALRFRRSGQASEMEMGLNAGTHRRIHDRIHRWSRLAGWVALPATVLLGVVVSGMEFVCTGQIYLPTIIAINSAGFNLRAFGGLLLYNTAFILPLLAVTVLAYWGVGAKSLAAFAREHVFGTKILMTALFLLLAALMVCLAWTA